MRKLNLLFLLLVLGTIAKAQDNFLLYSYKGNVTVVENKIESKAKIGKTFSGNVIVKISNGAVATFICNEAAMFTVKKAGNYTLSQFKDSCAVSSSSVSANYVKYVWNQLTNHSEGAPGSNRKAYMNSVGAVSRSVNNIWIDPRLDTINYSSGDFPLSWKSYSDAKEFEFYLYNKPEASTPFYKTTISKMKVSVPKLMAQIKPGNSYYWTASVKGEQNDELKVLNYVTKETYNQLLESIKNTNGPYESEAEQSYRIAFMLEDAHYLSEAYQYYTKAATAASDNALYRFTLMSFKKDYEIK
jgi:hypothetical protein